MTDKHTVAQLGEVGVHDQDGREHQHNAQNLDRTGGLGIDTNAHQYGDDRLERHYDGNFRCLEPHGQTLHI